ncbi:MAG: hypothetical protein MJE68_05605 [Proteobacteria bacterium]|nr:hypothetical protein [Pseudomonadota bacterium]
MLVVPVGAHQEINIHFVLVSKLHGTLGHFLEAVSLLVLQKGMELLQPWLKQ